MREFEEGGRRTRSQSNCYLSLGLIMLSFSLLPSVLFKDWEGLAHEQRGLDSLPRRDCSCDVVSEVFRICKKIREREGTKGIGKEVFGLVPEHKEWIIWHYPGLILHNQA